MLKRWVIPIQGSGSVGADSRGIANVESRHRTSCCARSFAAGASDRRFEGRKGRRRFRGSRRGAKHGEKRDVMEAHKLRAVALRCEHLRGKASRKKLLVAMCVRTEDGKASEVRASTSAVRPNLGFVAWLDQTLQTVVRPRQTVVFKLRCLRGGMIESTIGKAEFEVMEELDDGVRRFQLEFYNSKGSFVGTLHMVLQLGEIDRSVGETSLVDVEAVDANEGDETLGDADDASEVSSLAVSDSMLADASIPTTPVGSPDRSTHGELMQRLLSAIPEDRVRAQTPAPEEFTMQDLLVIWDRVWCGMHAGDTGR